MTRALHLGLLLMALLGLIGQSGAMAMAPAPMDAGSMQASMASMNCVNNANAPVPGKLPCEKMTMQCIAAMGCASIALVEPVGPSTLLVAVARVKSALPPAARLWGRCYGPEPDPPSFLI